MKLLRYSHIDPESDSFDFTHQWHIVLHYTKEDEEPINILKSMVEWCYENWNDDPHKDHEWYYVLTRGGEFMFDDEEGWDQLPPDMPLPIWTFMLATHEDNFAIAFKLRWGQYLAN